MKKEISTHQMVETLGVGEIAECVQDKQCKAVKRFDGAIVWEDDLEKFVHLNPAVMQSTWIVKPNYTTFFEAMTALDKGGIVNLHIGEKSFRFNKDNRFILGELAQEELVFWDLLKGKWTIG